MSSSSNPQLETRGRVDDRLDPFLSQRLGETPSELRPNISERVIDDDFGDWNFPQDSSNKSKIKKFLAHVWTDVKLAFENDPKLGENVANMEEFLANVKLKGEWEFIDSLKAMAASGDWAGLFDDGMLFFSFDSKYSDHFLHLEVFKPKQSAKEDTSIDRVDSTLVKGAQ